MSDYAAFVAKKYAQAFLNVAGASFTRDDFKKACVLERFLQEHRAQVHFLRSPIKQNHAHTIFLQNLLAPFESQTLLTSLVQMLVQHRRLFLLPLVMRSLCQLFAEQHGITHLFIEASHDLSESDCGTLADFIAHKTRSAVIYEYSKHPELIAGIRLRSDTLLWEYSVDKQLKLITNSRR